MIHSLVQIVAPRFCLICESQLFAHRDAAPAGVCDGCRIHLPRLRATPGAADNSTGGPTHLAQIGKQAHPAYPTICAFSYEQPIQNLIKDFKFRGRLDIGAGLADELARELESHPIPEAMIPVPLHPRRLRHRGFNQATEIARRLQQNVKIPILINNINRTSWSHPQTGLNPAKREQNVAGAFAIGCPIPAHVAIVDDVITSGATTGALISALHRAGARHFALWALARAVIR